MGFLSFCRGKACLTIWLDATPATGAADRFRISVMGEDSVVPCSTNSTIPTWDRPRGRLRYPPAKSAGQLPPRLLASHRGGRVLRRSGQPQRHCLARRTAEIRLAASRRTDPDRSLHSERDGRRRQRSRRRKSRWWISTRSSAIRGQAGPMPMVDLDSATNGRPADVVGEPAADAHRPQSSLQAAFRHAQSVGRPLRPAADAARTVGH